MEFTTQGGALRACPGLTCRAPSVRKTVAIERTIDAKDGSYTGYLRYERRMASSALCEKRMICQFGAKGLSAIYSPRGWVRTSKRYNSAVQSILVGGTSCHVAGSRSLLSLSALC